MLEIDASNSDVTCIPAGDLIFFILCRRNSVIDMCFHVVCFLVNDLDIPAFEIYCPVFGIVGRKATARDVLFFSSSKSIITSRHVHRPNSPEEFGCLQKLGP